MICWRRRRASTYLTSARRVRRSARAARTSCVHFLFSSCSVARREARRRYVEPRFLCSSRSLRGKHRRRVVPGLLFFSVVYREIQGNTGKRALPQPRSPPPTTALMPPWRSVLVRSAALQRPSLVHARCRPRSESRGFPARCEAVDRWQAAAGRARRSARP